MGCRPDIPDIKPDLHLSARRRGLAGTQPIKPKRTHLAPIRRNWTLRQRKSIGIAVWQPFFAQTVARCFAALPGCTAKGTRPSARSPVLSPSAIAGQPAGARPPEQIGEHTECKYEQQDRHGPSLILGNFASNRPDIAGKNGKGHEPYSLGSVAFQEIRALAQTVRSSIIFLISAIALAGFNPFGQVLEQFIIVWQR